MKKTMHLAAILALALAIPVSPLCAAGLDADAGPRPAQPARHPVPDEVSSLFLAASEGDEATFARLLGTVGNLRDVVVDEKPLLHALLAPAVSVSNDERHRRTQPDQPLHPDVPHWREQRAAHIALLAAKTRMLALALEHGAAVNAGDRYGGTAALHLAATFGTAEMVGMLLAHGADVEQLGGPGNTMTPLAFALDQHASGLVPTELITRQERTAIVLKLLAAGARRPYWQQDEREPQPVHRADLMWNAVVQLTTGTAVLDALALTGTTPFAEDAEKSPYAFAAEAGNAEAIGWLKTRVPRIDGAGNDRWLDAAMRALYLPAPEADAVLAQLLVKGMPWAQTGPLSSPASVRFDYRPMEVDSALDESRQPVLVHAARAGRADWIERLLAYGAPLAEGGSRALAFAVEQGSPATVELLLGLGADPLAWDHLSLEILLYGDQRPGRKNGVTVQAAVLLPLLLEHIVTVQKKPLAQIVPSPLEQAVIRADGVDGARRVRMLLDAGFPANVLSDDAAIAALKAPDRTLADTLLAHGMLRLAPGQQRPDNSNMLLAAVIYQRTDLLPRLLQLGFDPNEARPDRISPIALAIKSGAIDALAALLAGGGRIDLAARDGELDSMLDLAVTSGNAAVLTKVSNNLALRLDRVCLRDDAALVNTVLNVSNAYWDLLRRQGFASDAQACPGMPERVVRALAGDLARPMAGWLSENLRTRLPQLGTSGAAPVAIDTAIWDELARLERDDLRLILAQSGWAAPQQTRSSAAADAALRKTVPGRYRLDGWGNADNTIVLQPNGTFDYALVFDEVKERARGRWTVRNGRVVFGRPPNHSPVYVLAPHTQTATTDGEVMVALGIDRLWTQGLTMTLLGDAPLMAVGREGRYGWTARMPGYVRQIVLTSKVRNTVQRMVIEVPPEHAMDGTFMLSPDPQWLPALDFYSDMDAYPGRLMWKRNFISLDFEKKGAPVR